MKGAFAFGILMAAGTYFCRQVLPQPSGTLIGIVFVAAFLLPGIAVTWIRTRLPFVTAGMLAALVALGLIAWAEWQGTFLTSGALGVNVAVVVLLVLSYLGFFLESKVHASEWQRWRQHMDNASLLDILRLRHIPWLRSGVDQR